MLDRISAYTQEVTNIGKLNNFASKEYWNCTVYEVDGITFHVYHQEGVLTTITLNGSIPKFLYGNNLKTSDRTGIGEFIVKLERKTGLRIRDFKVTQLEIGINLSMNNPVKDYTEKIRYLPRYTKSRNNSTVTFRNGSGKFIFYDKIKEIKQKEGPKSIPRRHDLGPNVLRIEQGIKKNIKRLKKGLPITPNNTESVLVKDLFHIELYRKYPKLLQKKYDSTDKKKTAYLQNVCSIKDINDHRWVSGIDDKEKVRNEYKLLEKVGQLTKNQVKYAIKRMNDAFKNNAILEDDLLLQELDQKFEKFLKYYSKPIREEDW